MRLVKRAEYRFHGNIQSMDKVQLPYSNKETVILSFNDAKVIKYLIYTSCRYLLFAFIIIDVVCRI